RGRRPPARHALTPGLRAGGDGRVIVSQTDPPRRELLPRAAQRIMTMSSTRSKLMVAGVLVAGALGVIALKAAWATPPKGVTNTPIAGPVVLGDIDVVQQDPNYGAMIKTRGLSDAYVRHLTIAPGGDTGWHSHPGPVFVLVSAGTGSLYFADD